MNSNDDLYKVQCVLCPLKLLSSSDLNNHYRISHNIKFQQCHFCDNEFAFRSELNQHLRQKHVDDENKRHECQECSSSFKHAKSLRYHIQTRHVEKPRVYECNTCQKTFKYKASYTKHNRNRHSGRVNIQCDKCPKKFHYKDAARRHQQVHHSDNYEMAQCKLCPASYKYKEHLSTHMKKKHFANAKRDLCDPSTLTDEQKHRCYICSVYFKEKYYLLQHLKRYHNKNIDVFHCNHCFSAFRIKESYICHLKEQHGLNNSNVTETEETDHCLSETTDFEDFLMNNVEMRKLIYIKNRFAGKKNLVIVHSEVEDDGDEDDDDDADIEVDEDEADVTNRNIGVFFSSLMNINKQKRHFDYSIEEGKDTSPQDQNNSSDESNENHTMVYTPQNCKIYLNCKHCTEIFENEYSLLDHLAKTHNIPPKVLETNLIQTEKDIEENNTEIIELSDINTNSLDSLENENLVAGSGKKLQKRDKTKSKKVTMTKDIEDTYKCKFCERIFKLKAHLARHAKSCKAKSVNRLALDSNEEIPSMYQCSTCNALFPDENILERHELWEHEINVTLHKCCECGFIFYQLGDLEQHLEAHQSV